MAFTAGQRLTAAMLNDITVGSEQGEWTIAANLLIGAPSLINNWVPFTGAVIKGITHSAGVFTVGPAGGLYTVSLACRFTAATADRYCFVVGTGTTDTWTKSSVGSSATGLNTSVAITKRVPPNGQIRCYAYAGVASSVTHETASDLVTGVTIVREGPL